MPNPVEANLPQYYQRLWRYCLVLTTNRATADDLAQSTALRALERAQQFQTKDGLDKWLFRIAHSIWLNELRSQAIRRGGGIVTLDEVEIVDTKSNTETNIFAREVLLKVMGLPEAQRTTLFLTYIEGYSYKETAEILGIPTGTVMSRLAAARKTIVAATNVTNWASEK